MTRAERWLCAACVWVLMALLALTAGFAERRGQTVNRLESNERRIARVCTFRPDGSATCPPETFHVDRVAK